VPEPKMIPSTAYLAEAIESILNQTYKNFEFFIVNDGSKDKSVEIIKNYMKEDDRIILINRENKGLIYSLNEGISIAKGNYIARMDADDMSLPERFEKHLEKPKVLEELLNVATKLSQDFPYVRVDLYVSNSKIYFGELTFRPYGGFMKFVPDTFDIELGKYLHIPNLERKES
jgi:glycosyltransferase involved in cell wall biosynthesis